MALRRHQELRGLVALSDRTRPRQRYRVPLACRCSLPGLHVQDLISTESAYHPCLRCPACSPPCSSSVIPALLQTHWADILKNSGIHPQYGFLLIIAFCLCRLHVLLTVRSCDYLHSFTLLCFTGKSSINVLPVHFSKLSLFPSPFPYCAIFLAAPPSICYSPFFILFR